jgi:hypothetical protein
MRLGGSPNPSGRFIEEKSVLPLPGFELRFISLPALDLVDLQTALLRFCMSCLRYGMRVDLGKKCI